MDLHEIIEEAQNIIYEATVDEQDGDLEKAYNQIDKLHDLLVEEFVPLERS